MPSGAGTRHEAAAPGGLFAVGLRVLLVDSITEAVGPGAGCIAVSGSHGGLSAARFAFQAGVRLAVFNDAGIGKDSAGIAGLDWLQAHGTAAVAVAHHSARIGEAASTWNHGRISAVNALAGDLGAQPGLAVRDWLLGSGAATPRLSGS